jgi:bacillolysin
MSRSGFPQAWLFACTVAGALAAASLWFPPTSAQQRHRGLVTVGSLAVGEIRDWGSRVDSMRRAGDLRMRITRTDTMLSGRSHVRLDQYHRGVRIFGADVTQQLNRSQVVSVFGNVYDNIDIDTSPSIGAERAREIVAARAGVDLGPGAEPELVILPRDDDSYTLTWRVRTAVRLDVHEYFVDARSGAIAFDYSDRQSQRTSAVGRAQGVLGDTKKISVSLSGGRYMTSDLLRPPAITTYDMQGNPTRTENFLNNLITLGDGDIASDTDNAWTDGAVGDAHVYAGWTYDFYFKRFNRRGLDNSDRAMRVLVHPIRRSEVFTLFDTFPEFFTNAFYLGDGIVVFGVGLPPNVTLGGKSWDFMSGALDVVAHELTHGVTDYSSRLIYLNESGALNEAFSDMMGTAAEFFYQPAGSGNLRADYLCGEDVVRPGGIRSMSDPLSFGDPDHYSRRFTGREDNGGVHINSGIANNAFYLAIEGGSNRTSGLAVQGVGGGNREQIERVFYRAFTQMLPATATFAIARVATIQAARDLFGTNSNAERAVTQAWTAVGVN